MCYLTLYCTTGKHEYTLTFTDPVDWNLVQQAINDKEPVCEIHARPTWYYDCE